MPNINLPNDFPSRLQALRKEQFLSESELGLKAGLTYKTIRELERGKRQRIMERTLLVLANALGISQSQLLHGEESAQETNSRLGKIGIFKPYPRLLEIGITVVVVLGLVFLALFWTGRGSANFKIESDMIVAYDPIFKIQLWEKEYDEGISFCQSTPWNDSCFLIGLGKKTPHGGVVLCLDRSSGDTLWTIGPDWKQIEDIYGVEIARAANFSASSIQFGNIDGDGETDLIVRFNHGRYFPSCLLWINQHGDRVAQYTNRGHLSGALVMDLDGDDLDEVLAYGTNNAPEYQGGTLILLDEGNWSGHSIENVKSDAEPGNDSSLIRLIFPAFPPKFMAMMGAMRLSVNSIQAFENSDQEILLNVTLGSNPNNHLILTLDDQLAVIGAQPSDYFLTNISKWPVSLTNNTGPGCRVWLANWLAGHQRFEKGILINH